MAKQNEKPKVLTKKHVARLEREKRQVTIVWTVSIAMFVVIALLIGYGILDTQYLRFQKPVAEVNGEKITIAQWQERVQWQRVNLANLYQRYQFFQQQFGMDTSQQLQEIQYYLQSPEAVGQLVLDQLVDEALIRQEAEKRGITVTEAEVEEAVQTAYRYYPNGTPVPTITPTAFEYPTLTTEQLTIYPSTATPTTAPTSTPEATATPDLSATPTATSTAAAPTPTFVPEDVPPTATPYTLEGFQTEYTKTLDEYKTYGITEKTLREVYKNDLLRTKLQEAITAEQPAMEEQAWARHILVDNETEAKTVEALLANGADFAKMAQRFSSDTGSAQQGGDLGWFGKGMMVPEFEAAAFSQPIGGIGQPVKSQFGYHIIQVIARQELPLSASQLQQNRDKAFSDWLTTAKDSAQITSYDTWMQQIPPSPDFNLQ